LLNSPQLSLTRWVSALLVILGFGCSVSVYASPQTTSSAPDSAAYTQAIASPVRTDEDRNADAKRDPLDFLQFTRVQPGMRVLDVAAGGGYTSQLLALIVGEKGTVWAQTDKPRKGLDKRLADHPQPNIVPLVQPYEDPVPGNAPKLDLITIIMNYHDIAYMPVDRSKMNERLFNALKSGGHLVVLDHSAKTGSGIKDTKTLHRIEETVVINEFQQAGFKLDEQGEFLRNPADPREQAFFDMKIQSDKFALRFIKP